MNLPSPPAASSANQGPVLQLLPVTGAGLSWLAPLSPFLYPLILKVLSLGL